MKITNEPPLSIRANILRALDGMRPDFEVHARAPLPSFCLGRVRVDKPSTAPPRVTLPSLPPPGILPPFTSTRTISCSTADENTKDTAHR